jgi:small basic protein (TIGR04137 family)
MTGDRVYSWVLPSSHSSQKSSQKRKESFASMTIDKSLKIRAGAIQNRNVLTRPERLAKLKESERWQEGDPVLGMPKVRVQKVSLKKKKKTKGKEDEK